MVVKGSWRTGSMHMKSNNRFGTINTRVVEHLIYIYWSYNIPIGIVYSPVQASRAARTCHHTLPIPPTRHPSTHPPDGAHFRVPLPPLYTPSVSVACLSRVGRQETPQGQERSRSVVMPGASRTTRSSYPQSHAMRRGTSRPSPS